MRKLEANIDSSHLDFDRKSSAFFKYAAYDDHMVCSAGILHSQPLLTPK
jgi:hypothetical protein